jgi:hypothetical protein
MLDYNNRQTSDRRRKARELDLNEEEQVQGIINERLRVHSASKEDEELLYRFMRRYQYLSAYLAATRGLWCTEFRNKISDPQKVLFDLRSTFHNKDSEEERNEYEDQLIVPLLNQMLEEYAVTKEEEELLQRFIDHYQNMYDYNAYTAGEISSPGLLATDEPEKVIDPEKTLFRLGFQDDPIEGGEYVDTLLRNISNNISNSVVAKDGSLNANDQ